MASGVKVVKRSGMINWLGLLSAKPIKGLCGWSLFTPVHTIFDPTNKLERGRVVLLFRNTSCSKGSKNLLRDSKTYFKPSILLVLKKLSSASTNIPEKLYHSHQLLFSSTFLDRFFRIWNRFNQLFFSC